MSGGGISFSVSGNIEKVNEYRKAFRLTDKDNVSVFLMRKGTAGKRAGSFIYRQMTAKGQTIQAKLRDINSEIKKVELSGQPTREKLNRLDCLRAQKNYLSTKLNAEMSAAPRSGFIVAEEEE